MDRLPLDGIRQFIPFLEILEKHKIAFQLEKSRPEAVMVTIYIVGRRIELEFFDDHIEYSWFDGDESVHDDQDWLYQVLEDWVSD